MEDHELTQAGWDPLEVIASLVTAAVTVLVAAGAIGGIIGATGPMPYPSFEDMTSTIILQATGWVTLGLILLLGALASLWLQVRRWSAAGDGAQTLIALHHLKRSRRLATWIGVLLLAVAGAAVADLVATFLPTSPSLTSALGWERYATEIGLVLALLLGVVGGLYLVQNLTLQCRASEADTIDEPDEPDEE
jgi:hypothetical protein